MGKKYSPQVQMLTRKGIFYTGIILLLFYVLQQAGVKMSAIFGAAGIAGIAIGFAAQTSISNIISGIFLVSEKPFALGDIISVEGKLGIVESMDLLSIKLKTFDNLFIRIPNTTIINTNVTNITRYPLRRMNFELSVAYKEDLSHVRGVLMDIAMKNPYCLDDPAPYFLIKEFGTSGVALLLGLWFEKNDYTDLKNSIMTEILERFRKESIEIPFPHISVYTGETTKPFPVASQKK
ncbi:mechanosensitive ion channel family protein [Candidatus Mcinerneyibacteriota bacterium]|nr:mechanosensitive ion channel family protein [Candidatus Mcinerneyibacteriota bacterium]